MDATRVRIAALAAVLLAAGILPWCVGTALTVRLIALPFLLAGVLTVAVAVRLPAVRARLSAPPQPEWPLLDRCSGCVCGGDGCATAAAPGASAPVAQAEPDGVGQRQP